MTGFNYTEHLDDVGNFSLRYIKGALDRGEGLQPEEVANLYARLRRVNAFGAAAVIRDEVSHNA